MVHNQYEPIIGLEIHIELKTETGMFCRCKVNQFGAPPNTHVCPVCLGLPGALPVPNKKAIEWTVMIGLALNCTINRHTKFDRKHYTYPDLPKGYQISQYDEPIAVNGHLNIKATKTSIEKLVRIHRVHLEEDTGKLIHEGKDTLVDFNRSGTPLVEIVTEPDFNSSEDVKVFLEELHTLIKYLDVSDADLEKGSMRMEPNISVRVIGQKELPNYKVEVKNINSFNFVKKAIDYEVARHIDFLSQGQTPPQETRGWDSQKNCTYSQRTKEEAHDYRYFPEPDIPPILLEQSYIDSIVVPTLPQQKVETYMKKYGLKYADAFILTRNKASSDAFDLMIKQVEKDDNVTGVDIANAIINKKITSYEEVKRMKAPKVTDSGILLTSIEKILSANEKVVADYKSGKQNAVMFLVGQVMREMKGQADANTVREELIKKLT